MLANWFFFWTEADWVPGTASATATASISVSISTNPSNAGGGGWRASRYSEPLSDDYWDTRERYLRKLVQVPKDKPLPVPTKIVTSVKAKPPVNASLREQQAYAIATARLAKTRSELLRIGQTIAHLSTKIDQFENQEIELLLMAAAQSSII